jgi:hypothetical protein
MTRIAFALTLAAGLAAGYHTLAAQSGTARTPFKLGTFERAGRVFVGLAVRDTHVADIA